MNPDSPTRNSEEPLYVAMARMKELEGEVISMLIELDDRQYVLEISGGIGARGSLS